jgi:organic hydroperoxide reductase OsmC/OhrA
MAPSVHNLIGRARSARLGEESNEEPSREELPAERRSWTMTAPLPHHYNVDLSWEADRHGTLSGDHFPSLVGGPPRAYEGRDDWWSPEHLLVAAAELCLMTTFLTMAKHDRLEISGYHSRAEGTVDKTEEGAAFSFIVVDVEIKAHAKDLAAAAELLQRAKAHCIVSKSLRRPIELRIRLTASE